MRQVGKVGESTRMGIVLAGIVSMIAASVLAAAPPLAALASPVDAEAEASGSDHGSLDVAQQASPTSEPNVFDVDTAVTGRDYAANTRHVLFLLDRTGSIGQADYKAIASRTVELAKRLTRTGQVQVSFVLFAGTAEKPESVYYDGWEVPRDLDHLKKPDLTNAKGVNALEQVSGNVVSQGGAWTANRRWLNPYTGESEFYGNERWTSWKAAFDGAKTIMNDNTLPTDVVFFSDGSPYAEGKWSTSELTNAAIDAAKKVLANDPNVQSFNVVGLDRSGMNKTTMQRLANEAVPGKGALTISADPDKIISAIEDTVTCKVFSAMSARDVSIKMDLTKHVLPAVMDDHGRVKVKVTIEEHGKTTTLTEGDGYDYSFDAAAKTLTIKLKNQLDGAQTAHIRFSVKPTSETLKKALAGEKGPDGNGWPATSGPAGTHIDQAGDLVHSAGVAATILPQLARLTYDGNEGVGDMSGHAFTVAAGTTLAREQYDVRSEFRYEGHEFAGWCLDPLCKSGPVQSTLTLPAGTTTLYAHWLQPSLPTTGETAGDSASTAVMYAMGGSLLLVGVILLTIAVGRRTREGTGPAVN